MSSEEELRALRLAAESGDLNGCWSASQRLLRKLPSRQSLRWVLSFIIRRLPAFERHQPGVHWPREFIESVSEIGSADNRIWPEAEDDFPGPGANSFTSAVEALWKASLSTQDEQRRSELLADAIERTISAERLEYWGTRHPEEWALWYQLASSGLEDPRIAEIQLTIMEDPEATRVRRSAWLEAAQLLEEALNASTREPQ